MTRHSSRTVASVAESITGAKRYRPYPAYRDSGIEWLGEIPAHWKVAPIYAHYQVALGKMLDAKKNFGDSPGEYVRNTDVQWDSVNTTNLPTMDFSPQERDRYGLQFGDLLVCEGGEVGRTAIWQGTTGEYFYQKAIHRVRPLSDQEVPRFLYYTMRMLSAKGVFVAGSNPNTINHLTAVQLRHYRVLFPPRPDQNAIAAFLDDETEKIELLVAKKERLIELLRENRTALITHAVTKGICSDAPMKDSGVEWLGEIPGHWEVRENQRLFRESDLLSMDGSEELLTVSHITGVTRRSDKPDVTMIEAESHEGYKLCHAGDLAINTMWAWMGALGVAFEDGIVSPSYNVYRIRANTLSPDYFDYLCRIPTYVVEITRHSKGIWSSRLRLYPDGFLNLRTPLPPTCEQRAIVDFLDEETGRIDALVARVQQAIDRLKELCGALIAAAVTGKIDVRETPA